MYDSTEPEYTTKIIVSKKQKETDLLLNLHACLDLPCLKALDALPGLALELRLRLRHRPDQ